MIINHNMSAINANNVMSKNQAGTAKVLEKLSSGLRINRAADDAAGLSISEKMRAQIRGLDVATRNSSEGINMIQTAEGALGEVHEMIKNMRDKLVQAGNDTNTSDDRKALQDYVNAISSEVNRVGNTTEYNTMKLLNGGDKAADNTQLNSKITQTVTTSGGKAGKVSNVTGTKGVSGQSAAEISINATNKFVIKAGGDGTTDLSGYTLNITAVTGAGTVALDGTTINISVSATLTAGQLQAKLRGASSDFAKATVSEVVKATGKSVASASYTAAAKASIAGAKTFTAPDPTAAEGRFEFTIQNAFVTAGDQVSIKLANNPANKTAVVTITLSAGSTTTANTFNIGDADNRFTAEEQAAQIALALSKNTSVNTLYNFKSEGNKVVMEEKQNLGGMDGVTITSQSGTATAGVQNIQIRHILTAGSTVSIDGNDISVVEGKTDEDKKAILAGTAIQAASSANAQASSINAAIGKNVNLQNYTATVSGDTITMTQKATKESNVPPKVTISSELPTNKFDAKLQIGANSGQSLTVEIGDMRAQALNITSATGGKIASKDGKWTASFTANKVVSNGTNNTATEYALDVSTHDKATAAISVMNDALSTVSDQRSKLGALQNRLEHTMNNLSTTAENLTSAESGIRDTNMAKTMMEFTKLNILNQASQGMLSQANQLPQGVLQLLR